ncbi:DUF3667 domain-containing protein [Pseudoduganella sp. FT55W]|uniref:DUF3667 domain-containing protein n=1 Tax=Duganella rivi TaxID=2666083 RepID=A0A7X4KEU6_9BURK|nr:DUF3667 domain-containing protein [Duganella rivi]MYM69863.1 DUF3667 domain-containing protein [Duganella rivi]
MSNAATPDNCANCETPLSGHFCSNCGQEAVLHAASTREFLHEFVGHYVALEGKLWGSLKRLIFQPGELTNEYIRGRRVRYVQPLRMYLTFSVLFFALLKLTGGASGDVEAKVDGHTTAAKVVAPARVLADTVAKGQTKIDKAAGPEAEQSRSAAREAVGDMMSEMAAEDAKSEIRAAKAMEHDSAKEDGVDQNINEQYIDGKLADWPLLRRQWHALNQLPPDEQAKVFKNGMSHYAPYAIFCMMPVFALLLKVLYLGSGRRFGEHMLFALHTNAFAFLMFSVILLAHFGLAQFALWCWLIAYLPWAMRRVYHSSRLGTFVRWSVLMLFYMIGLLFAVLISGGMGILSVGH